MLSFRIIVVASTLAAAGIVGADGVAATGPREGAPKVLVERLPAAQGAFPVASKAVAVAEPRREGAPVPRLCPERGWPYGAPRCVAADDRKPLRIIALDAVRSTPETL